MQAKKQQAKHEAAKGTVSPGLASSDLFPLARSHLQKFLQLPKIAPSSMDSVFKCYMFKPQHCLFKVVRVCFDLKGKIK